MPPFLEVRAVSKTFPGVRALNGVDLVVARGEVHAVAGENGAGKSTLMKVMTGVLKADPGGQILVDGQPVEITDSDHARALGISIIYQELSTVETLTVAENIYLAREPVGRFGFIDAKRMNADARRVLDRLQMDIDPATRVGALSIGQKQMVEIAKAIAYESKIIIMDEPTASLSQHETATLVGLVHQLRRQDVGMRVHHPPAGRDLRDRRPGDGAAGRQHGRVPAHRRGDARDPGAEDGGPGAVPTLRRAPSRTPPGRWCWPPPASRSSTRRRTRRGCGT